MFTAGRGGATTHRSAGHSSLADTVSFPFTTVNPFTVPLCFSFSPLSVQTCFFPPHAKANELHPSSDPLHFIKKFCENLMEWKTSCFHIYDDSLLFFWKTCTESGPCLLRASTESASHIEQWNLFLHLLSNIFFSISPLSFRQMWGLISPEKPVISRNLPQATHTHTFFYWSTTTNTTAHKFTHK